MTDTFRSLCAELTYRWSRTTNPVVMTDLSPAAQAVMNATAEQVLADRRIKLEHITAAALRAAVAKTKQRQYSTCWICDANELLAIADELEADQSPRENI